MNLVWTSLDTWIVIAAALAGASCALVGSFLVLKKMSMMGDAISHAVLPGIAVAFILTGSRATGVMFPAAVAVGVLTTVLVQLIHRHGKLEQGASMGVVFTVLFATGLILIERAAGNVDIHPEHVLFGAVELVPLYVVSVAGFEIPRGVVVLCVVLLINLTVVVLLFKELRLATFDPELATSLGINAGWIHYLLMAMVAVTTVAAFEVVGSILVIAMLIVPGATAHLLTRRLPTFLTVAVALSVVAAVLGHGAAVTVPPIFGFEDTGTAGSMATILGLLFFSTFLLAPDQGVLFRFQARLRLRVSIATQDILGLLAREEEKPTSTAGSLTRAEFGFVARSPFQNRRFLLLVALTLLRMRGQIKRSGGRYTLTAAGLPAAREILRTHRLWERFFYDDARVDLSELHTAADFLEHYTDAELQEALATRAGDTRTDPRGKPIPERETRERRKPKGIQKSRKEG
jgi:manganese/zinc/iron transport system permease protein